MPLQFVLFLVCIRLNIPTGIHKCLNSISKKTNKNSERTTKACNLKKEKLYLFKNRESYTISKILYGLSCSINFHQNECMTCNKKASIWCRFRTHGTATVFTLFRFVSGSLILNV